MTRAVVLDHIRRRLQVTAFDAARQSRVAERIARHDRNTIPARAGGSREERIVRFTDMLTRVQGSTSRVAEWRDVPSEVAGYLGRHADVCLTPEVDAMKLPWREAEELRLTSWRPKTSMDVCITSCVGAAAETGTVVVRSANTSPITEHFLAECHIVLLDANRLFGAYEEVLDNIRDELPRHITFVSGPSCTGDIEMIMEYGAHGPRSLHVIIVGQ